MFGFISRHKARPLWTWIPSVLAFLGLAWLSSRYDRHAALFAINTFEYVDWMMQESLDILVNKLSIMSMFNFEVQKEFEHDFAVGETVRVKYPQEYLIRTGLAYTEQPIARRHTTVNCSQIFGIDFGWDSFEKALRMERGEAALSREYLEPAMAQMAQEFESRAALWAAQNCSTIVGSLGTATNTFDGTSAAARQKLVELGCPVGKDRAMIVPPQVMRGLKNAAIQYFNPVTDITKQFRDGIVGSGDGFDWYESVSLYQLTAGTWAAGVTVGAAGVTSGATSVPITSTGGDSFNLGDKFSFAACNPTNPRTRRRVGTAAKTFTVTQAIASATGGASGDTLNFWPPIYGPGSQYQNVDALPLAGAALTLFPGTATPNGLTGTVSLAIHPDAFACVAVEFDNPKPGTVEISKQLKDPDTGIAISFVRAFDPAGRRWINRFDSCIGFGNLWSDNCCVGVLGV